MAETDGALERWTYTMEQADRLLCLPPGTCHRWIDGYVRAGRQYPPVVRLSTTGDNRVTWGEFVEARLLAEFRSAGAPMLGLRPAVVALRREFKTPYPLAHRLPFLEVDGKELVQRVQEEVDLERPLLFVVVRNGQLQLSKGSQRFVESVEWDASGTVSSIRPDPDLDQVRINPLLQFGEPVVRAVRTSGLAELWRAGDKAPRLAQLYGLSEEQVDQALRYESRRGLVKAA